MDNNQQSDRSPVAPFNPNPQWPTGYFQVLEELGVEKQRHPFYLGPSSQLAFSSIYYPRASNVLTIPPVAVAADRPPMPSDHTTA